MNSVISVKPVTKSSGYIFFKNRKIKASLGKEGVTDSSEKLEGDNKTPSGEFYIRYIFYRSDRLSAPVTKLKCYPLKETDGWCDDPNDVNYNKYINFPFAARAEKLCRDDNVYDIIAVLSHNESPVIKNRGSAVFFHIATDDYKPTEGCVAVSKQDMLFILENCQKEVILKVEK